MNKSQLTGEDLKRHVENYLSMNFSFEDLPSLIEKIKSENLDDNHLGAIGLRKLIFLKDKETRSEEFNISDLQKFLVRFCSQNASQVFFLSSKHNLK